ncbi:ORF6N domain-containing protein [Magnetococcales bacterium HHB-1]
MTQQLTTQMVTIGDASLPIIEYRGKRGVTFSMIDQVHQRPEGTAKRNFRTNKKRFVEGDDFQHVDIAQKDEIRPLGIDIPSRGLILLFESGYLMLVKSFTDDLAWQVQRELVNRYFQHHPKSKAHQILQMAQLMVEQEERMLQLQINQLDQKKQIEEIMQRQNNMNGNTGYMTALAFCRKKKIQAPLLFAQKLGQKAATMCRSLNIRTGSVPDERWGTVNSYPIEVLQECCAAIGE